MRQPPGCASRLPAVCKPGMDRKASMSGSPAMVPHTSKKHVLDGAWLPLQCQHLECHLVGPSSSSQSHGGIPIGQGLGVVLEGAAGSPSPDPALCPERAAKACARLVPPPAVAPRGTWSPLILGFPSQSFTGSSLGRWLRLAQKQPGNRRWHSDTDRWHWQVTPAPALWWLKAGCGAVPMQDQWSRCDHAMPSCHGHVPCLCVSLPWAWSQC